MQKLTVIIPTHNEARNIAACLESVSWADERLVVDDFSDDGTPDIARAGGARVVEHKFQSPSSQKDFAIQQSAHPWVLSLDADERVTPELRDEIRVILAADRPADGYFIPIRSYFLGRRMRFGAWRGERKLRLFRRALTHYPERALHEAAEVKGRVGLCRGAITHYSYRTLDDCFVKMRRYAEWGAMERHRRGQRASVLRLLLHGPARFARDCILRLGLLDGTAGLILALFDASQVMLREAKLWELATRPARGCHHCKPGERRSD
ncbi:MAG: glycosyltransferase family 2 protein [Armatimonadota bacterium]|nr:MAG: glycosyltransferase family 2 protein [Armatimonadota bacterium]